MGGRRAVRRLPKAASARKRTGRRGRRVNEFPCGGAMLDLDGVHVCEQPVTVRSTENCPLGDVAPRESPEQAAVTPPHHEPGWAALLDLAGDLPLLIIGHHMSRRRLSSLAAL